MSFPAYLSQVQTQHQSGLATEPSYYDILKGLILSLGDGISVTIQPAHTLAGAPDLVVTKGDAVIGYIEAKDLNAPLGEVEQSEQLQRYRRSLGNLLLTDFLEFRWYVDEKLQGTARLGTLGKPRRGLRRREACLGGFPRCPMPIPYTQITRSGGDAVIQIPH